MASPLVGEQMPGLAQIARRGQRELKMLLRPGKIIFRQSPRGPARVARERAGRAAFATTPTAEILPAGDQLRRGRRAGRFDCKSAQFDAQIPIALLDQVGIFFQFAQGGSRAFRRAVSKVIACS